MKRKIKFNYWNAIAGIMVVAPEMPHKKGWTIEQLFQERGWDWLQFTGAVDSNGVEIYEGDIVKAVAESNHKENSKVSNVICSEEGAWCVNSVPSNLDNSHGLHLWWGGWKSIEVIGNIYQNPELITENEEV